MEFCRVSTALSDAATCVAKSLVCRMCSPRCLRALRGRHMARRSAGRAVAASRAVTALERAPEGGHVVLDGVGRVEGLTDAVRRQVGLELAQRHDVAGGARGDSFGRVGHPKGDEAVVGGIEAGWARDDHLPEEGGVGDAVRAAEPVLAAVLGGGVDGAAQDPEGLAVAEALDDHLGVEPRATIDLVDLRHDVDHVVGLLDDALVVVKVVGRDHVAAVVQPVERALRLDLCGREPLETPRLAVTQRREADARVGLAGELLDVAVDVAVWEVARRREAERTVAVEPAAVLACDVLEAHGGARVGIDV
mmetsp:Transcript_37656/g.100062  ORF Transcript_37656/g.100062 Transcript_37656/m.100062 type:complete len:306 (-) Transcript_37656:117-1034(-)